MKKLFFLFTVLNLCASAGHSYTLSGFQTPDSAQVDPEDGSCYVSNVNGAPSARDGNGYISKISSSGNIIIEKFIGGRPNESILHAPKGLAVLGKRIYVADIDTVKVFHKKSRQWLRTVDFRAFRPRFLNDITADTDGFLYVSDTLTNRIFKIDPRNNHQVTLFKKGAELGRPNGLLFNPKTRHLMVAAFQKGQILEIDDSGNAHVLKRGISTPDGMALDAEGNLFVSSLERGEVYRIPFFGRGELSIYLSGLNTPADISYDPAKKEMLIPSSRGQTVTSFLK